MLSRLQLSEEALIRLGQRPSKEPPRTELPDVVFYTGCNVLKTPHIALLCLDIMDKIGTDYQVMGGPTHCCGTASFAPATSTRSAASPTTPSTSCRNRNRARCWPGARVA